MATAGWLAKLKPVDVGTDETKVHHGLHMHSSGALIGDVDVRSMSLGLLNSIDGLSPFHGLRRQ